MDYDVLAAEMLRQLRGRRSQAAFSRWLGYRSNVANRWESCKAFPTATRFFQTAQRVRRQARLIDGFMPRVPTSMRGLDLASPAGVTALLQALRGKTPQTSVARDSGFSRHSVARWLSGGAEPRLPELLCLVSVMSRRLPDFVSCFVDPEAVPAIAGDWRNLQRARAVAYELPWSHAVLRALELERDSNRCQKTRIAQQLGLSVEQVTVALEALRRTGQIRRTRGGFRPVEVIHVNTSQDPTRAHALEVFWAERGVERLRRGGPGSFGYSLFAVSRGDLRKLCDLHREYVRAMQDVIAASSPGECVGLYCAQLVDLAVQNNALE